MPAAIESRVCIHCGTPFRPKAHRPDFCCAGCQFVHDLIAKNGLGQFYDLQEGGVPPVQALVFQKRDYSWLEELAANCDGTLQLDLQGLSCIGCAWLIEKLFSRQPGALAIQIDPTLGQASLRWQPGVFDLMRELFARLPESKDVRERCARFHIAASTAPRDRRRRNCRGGSIGIRWFPTRT